MKTGLFVNNNICPKCEGKPNIVNTITTKESFFSIKRINNYTCSKCGFKWSVED